MLLAATFAVNDARAQGGPQQAVATVANSRVDARYGDPSHPDLSGLWGGDQGTNFADYATTPLPLTPPYAAKLIETRRLFEAGTPRADSMSQCIAFSMPRFMTMPFEVLQTPGQLTLISYIIMDVRRVYTDGSGHTPDVEPSYNGDSAGHWEGDTLVIETGNLRAGVFDIFGVPHSDKLKIVERLRLLAPGKLEIQFTLTDPEALTRPWVVTRTYTKRPVGARFEEYVCENNRHEGTGPLN